MAIKNITIDGVTFTEDTFWRAPGSLVNIDRRNGFKLGHVTGYSRTGKVKVRVWSAVSKSWSYPQYYKVDQISQLDGSQLSARHRAVVKHARDNLIEMAGRASS